jgi:catechol-2,3-dioxygenase
MPWNQVQWTFVRRPGTWSDKGEGMQQSIVHIALVVRDYDEAIDFYVGKLGFELLDDGP